MNRASRQQETPQGCEVIDFDQALLDACPAEERADLLTEARIVAHAFAETGAPQELERIAESLSTGGRDGDMARARARKLAAALKRLAAEPWA